MTGARRRKRQTGRKKLVLIAVCVAVVAGIVAAAVYGSWYFSPRQKLLRSFERDDLAEVQRLYEQVEQVPEGFAQGICGKLETLCARYTQGDIEYSVANQTLQIYEGMNVPGTDEALALCRHSMETIKLSRQAYVRGQSLEASKDYPAAMDSYAQVIEEDLWGFPMAQQKMEDCENAYRDKILQEAAAFAQTQAYTDAMEKLREGLEVLAEDETLLSQLESYAQADVDKKRSDLLQAAARYVAAGDYPDAIALLEGREDDDQIHAMYLTYRQEYADVTLTAAQEAFTLEGYEAAVAIIEECLRTLPENETLQEQKAWYESYKPEYLSELGMTVSEGSKLYINQRTQDQQQHTYTYSLAVNKGSITFQMGGEFALLTGTVACPYGFEYDKYRTGASIQIYADGVLLYESSLVETDSLPQHFELDISGAEQITITWQCEGPNIWKNWGDRATVFDAVLYRHAEGNS